MTLSHSLTAQAPTILYYNDFFLIQENSVKALVSPQIPNFAIYGALAGQDDIIYLLEEIRGKYPELWRIIQCESGFRNICNQKYGCYAGMGFGQIIPSTIKYCEKKLERSLDPLNELDNLECSLWLYLNEGTIHWEKWSGYCWQK